MAAGKTTNRVLVLAAVAAVFVGGAALAAGPQDPKAEPHDHAAAQSPGQDAGSRPGMAHMMAMQQQMMADHAAADARLKTLIDKMNGAGKGNAKVDAMAAVVAELVAQRTVMMQHLSHMMMMSSEMPGGMAGATSGTMAGASCSMAGAEPCQMNMAPPAATPQR